MSFFGNVLDFERFKLGNMWEKVNKNPEQLLLGAGDPLSAGAWSKITGKNYEPLVDQWGGATPDDYQKAEAAGIDTSAGRTMHGAARTIAGLYAGNAASTAMGSGGLLDFSGGQSPAPIVDMSTTASPQTVSAMNAAPASGASSGSGWQTAGQFAGLANQSGLLSGGQQMQPPPAQFQQGQGFAGLLNPTDQVDMEKRRQAQQMAVQGLLGGYRG